ncbi:hypothetical protein [Microbispora bryophytorum]|uniref:hypothetical protein n=1 Tax=Microbispora bryophytorum TaxID=1460882 RepID=UPI0033EBE18C
MTTPPTDSTRSARRHCSASSCCIWSCYLVVAGGSAPGRGRAGRGSYSARTVSMAYAAAALGVRGLATTGLHRLHRAAA